MDPLVHRLRELDPITFQELCFHLMREKFPGANVRYVEGASGDKGLDIFCGDLQCGPTIWQCKSFRVIVIGDSQKRQIRKSLRDAAASSSPRLWVLCLNIDLDTKSHRWFQKLQASYAAKSVLVELVQGSDIVHELMFRRTLTDHYFPNASILDEIRKLVPRSSVLTEGELEPLPGEAVEEYITRLRDKDPRFIYEITIGGDRGPAAFPPPPEPGIVAAITDGRKTVKAYARDTEALLRDPVQFSVTFTETGVEKMLAAIQTGRPQHFEPDEIRGFTGNVPLFSFLDFSPGQFALDLSLAPLGGPIPLRLSFQGTEEKLVYELIEFEVTRAGTGEVEISTKNKDMPFQISFAFVAPLALGSKVGVNIKKQFVGKDAILARKALAAFHMLRAGCRIELFSLQQEKKIGVVAVPPVKFDIPIGMRTWVDRLARVSEHFGVPIKLPEPRDVREADFDSLAFLYALASGEGVQIDEIGIKLVKTEQNSEAFPIIVRQAASLAIVHEYAKCQLLGVQFSVGRFMIQFAKAEFNNPERALLDFQKASVGEGVPLSIHPLAPAKIFHVVEHEETPNDAKSLVQESTG